MRIERLSLKDKQKMKFLVQTNDKSPVTEKDEIGDVEYISIDGELVPLETGEYRIGHEQEEGGSSDQVVEFLGNISFSGDSYFHSGGTVSKEYGIDDSDYDAVLVVPKDSLPITETSYIWYDSEVCYEDAGQTRVDVTSADYRVVKIVPSLGICRYLLKAVVH